MIVHVDPEDLMHFAKAWLKHELGILNANVANSNWHPDDIKDTKKDIKAVKRLLEYLGEQL
jgi:hypothetical protein